MASAGGAAGHPRPRDQAFGVRDRFRDLVIDEPVLQPRRRVAEVSCEAASAVASACELEVGRAAVLRLDSEDRPLPPPRSAGQPTFRVRESERVDLVRAAASMQPWRGDKGGTELVADSALVELPPPRAQVRHAERRASSASSLKASSLASEPASDASILIASPRPL